MSLANGIPREVVPGEIETLRFRGAHFAHTAIPSTCSLRRCVQTVRLSCPWRVPVSPGAGSPQLRPRRFVRGPSPHALNVRQP